MKALRSEVRTSENLGAPTRTSPANSAGHGVHLTRYGDLSSERDYRGVTVFADLIGSRRGAKYVVKKKELASC